MNDILAVWADIIKPSAGLTTVQWSLLLALAAACGHLPQRHTGPPKVVGYSVIGGLAGLAGFKGAAWPLQGTGLFLLELTVAVVLFEAGGRLPLRWFRHNPMLRVSQFVAASGALGREIGSVALPAILRMEVLGAVLATVAIYRCGESSRPWRPPGPWLAVRLIDEP